MKTKRARDAATQELLVAALRRKMPSLAHLSDQDLIAASEGTLFFAVAELAAAWQNFRRVTTLPLRRWLDARR